MSIKNFIGTWELIKYEAEVTETKEKVNHPYGKNPIGLLIYTSDGMMSGQVMNTERVKLSKFKNFNNGTPEEIKKAYQGYVAYFGKFSVNEKEQYVEHFVKGSLIPNWVGIVLRRYYQFEDGKLKLQTPPVKSGETNFTVTLTFKKIG